ncbi:ABC transporter ATP-binding protein [Spiroplasma turonicum]|uniref:ABC transporter ATP-binding protein n=1 Tax=Spiroplasma turonicum TaxID=216946 RepID=A0A0K1P593_9MOLU|nr:ABC transporter ATP-binding protein [Spiroplasma turonicum]AKU79453.1 ABC transporter ATP-binding protein [Spiroplasma turonicum]ALX70475.1 ABC transporter ATP-binding protein [Spiroplasma turonicum]
MSSKYEEKAKAEIIEKIKQEREQHGYLYLLCSYLKHHPWSGFIIIFLSIIGSGMAVSIPLMMQQTLNCISLLEQGEEAAKTNFLIWKFGWQEWVYLQLSVYVVLAIIIFIRNITVGKLGRDIEVHLRNETLKSLLKQDISYYSNQKIGEILTKIGADTWLIGEQTRIIPTMMLMALFNFIGSSVVLVVVDYKLGLIAMGFVTIGLILMFIFLKRVKKWVTKLRTTITYVNGDITDRIGTIRLIKASGTEVYEKNRFKEIHNEFYHTVKKFFKRLSFVMTGAFTTVMAVQLVVLSSAYGFYHNDNHKLIIISTTFIAGLGTMTSPIYLLLRSAFGYMMANECTRRIYQITSSKARFDSHYYKGEGKFVEKLDKDIIFKGVSFNYPEKPEVNVLPKFDFVFEKGKSYAFVGETGSGKSSIAKLLLRFYDPTEGEVLINNDTNLKDVHLKSFLDLVGYVEQEPQIMFGTVKENIMYTNPNATDEQVIEASKKANLHDLVMSWPNEYNTILGERGFMLSGGQKQRLVIARTFLKNPDLLILDEATSALDNIVEKEIQVELNKLMKNRTSISIAHRLSTIKNCDQIIVLARGKGVVQMGTFNELRNKKGHFKDLYDAGLMKEEQVQK